MVVYAARSGFFAFGTVAPKEKPRPAYTTRKRKTTKMEAAAFIGLGLGVLTFLRARLSAARSLAAARPHRARALALQAAHGYGLACRPLFAIDFAASAHLNHGSYGAAPHAIMAAARAEMLKIEAWPDRFMRRTALGIFRAAADALGGALLRAPAGSCAFVENATVGVNAVLRSLRLGKGDVIVLTKRACCGGLFFYPPTRLPTPGAPFFFSPLPHAQRTPTLARPPPLHPHRHLQCLQERRH